MQGQLSLGRADVEVVEWESLGTRGNTGLIRWDLVASSPDSTSVCLRMRLQLILLPKRVKLGNESKAGR